jgi:hypothetical protein
MAHGKVRCPRCGIVQPGLEMNGQGQLVAGVQVIVAYQCVGCLQTIHWGIRGNTKKVKVAG